MKPNPLDDYPIHQSSESMSHVTTSDRNFYDRYYFNGFTKDGSVMFVVGVGTYINLGVMDAFVLVSYKGQHRVVRASREVEGANRLRPSVGPISIDVEIPLERLRVTCEPNEWGIELDAVWNGAMPASMEPSHYIREHGRIIFDSSRLAQTGGWTGTLTVDGTKMSLTDDNCWGTRDRSWGIRPVGESEPAGIRASDPFSWFWIYTPIRFDDHSLLIIMQERQDGSRVLEQATRVWADGRHELLGRPEHKLTFQTGTRLATGGTITVQPHGQAALTITAEPMLPVHIGIGTGYGYDADWRHGMYQGPLKVEGVHIDLTTPEGAARMFGICDASAKFTYADKHGTHVGYGLFETMVIGPHDQYGFTDMLDGFAG
ncbi:MAG: hypothetical protein JHC78_08875 [Ilumatobacteraceae bacterium]|nr:hypothetical protein [Ilumatobacteraceae bacterium]